MRSLSSIVVCMMALPWSAIANASQPPMKPETANRPLRILQIRGLHFQYYRLEQAARLLQAEPVKISYGYHRAFEGKRGVTFFPASASELSAFDLVVMNDIPVSPHPAAQLQEEQLNLLRSYVENGGALLVIGGHNAFAGGGYGRSILSELLPVTVKERFDVEWLRPPVNLSSSNGHLAGLNWRRPPVAIWLHRFENVKPDAEVFLRAGEHPAVITWKWNQGRAGVVAATCYGVPPKGTTAFWDWPQWPNVLAQTIQWLTRNEIN